MISHQIMKMNFPALMKSIRHDLALKFLVKSLMSSKCFGRFKITFYISFFFWKKSANQSFMSTKSIKKVSIHSSCIVCTSSKYLNAASKEVVSM